MEKEYQYLLHLTGAYLNETAPEVWPDADWKKLVHLAHIHNLLGTLGYMSMCYPICPAEEYKNALRQSCRETIALCSHRVAMAEVLCRELAAGGAAFLCRNCAPLAIST